MTWTVTPIELDRRDLPRSTADSPARSCASCRRWPRSATAPVRFDGDAHARERPMATTIASLRGLGVAGRRRRPRRAALHGARRRAASRGGALDGRRLGVEPVRLGPAAGRRRASPTDSTCATRARPCPRCRTSTMTVAELRRRGVRVDDRRARPLASSTPARSSALDVRSSPTCPTPASSSPAPWSPAAACASATGRAHTDQAGDAWRDDRARVRWHGRARRRRPGVHRPATPRGVELDLHDVGELTPVVAAIAALAERPVTPHRHRPPARPRDRPTRGAGHRDQPARRRRRGARGRPGRSARARCTAARFPTYDDHRMAHAAAVIGLRVPDAARREHRHHRQDLPGLRRRSGNGS